MDGTPGRGRRRAGRARRLSVLVGGKAYEIKRERSLPASCIWWSASARYAVECAGSALSAHPRAPLAKRGRAAEDLIAPMPGKIVRFMVAGEDEVKAGQGVIVMEAMKMQNEMKSPKKGMVQKIVGERRRDGECRRRAGDVE